MSRGRVPGEYVVTSQLTAHFRPQSAAAAQVPEKGTVVQTVVTDGNNERTQCEHAQ